MRRDVTHRDSLLALAWHIAEFLLMLSLVGVLWSAIHYRPRFVETKA